MSLSPTGRYRINVTGARGGITAALQALRDETVAARNAIQPVIDNIDDIQAVSADLVNIDTAVENLASINNALPNAIRAEQARDAAIAASSSSVLIKADFAPVSITDSARHISGYTSLSGTLYSANLRARRLNGIRPESLILGQKYKRAVNISGYGFCGVIGQSLARTTFGGAPITTVQVGRAMLAPLDVANPGPNSFVSATIGAQPDAGEFPGFALVSEPYRLLERENALPSSRHNLVMVSGNNALGGTGISSNSKGTERYNRGIAQLTALKTRAIADGMPLVSFGNFAMIGDFEHQNNITFADVKAATLALARDYAADHRAILPVTDAVSRGQTFDPIVFVHTSSGFDTGPTFRASARAILSACIDYFEGVVPAGFAAPAPIVHLNPTHPYGVPLDDELRVHVAADGSYNLGFAGAEAIKRVFLDDIDPAIPYNRRWPPMYIIGVRRIGNTAVLKFQMRDPRTALTWGISPYPDGSGISEQQDYGFAVRDGSTLRTLLTPKIVAPDEVALTVATGSMTDGLRIGAGLDRGATKLLHHTGAAINLRDDYGDLVVCQQTGWPAHNWLSMQGVVLDSTTAGFTRYA